MPTKQTQLNYQYVKDVRSLHSNKKKVQNNKIWRLLELKCKKGLLVAYGNGIHWNGKTLWWLRWFLSSWKIIPTNRRMKQSIACDFILMQFIKHWEISSNEYRIIKCRFSLTHTYRTDDSLFLSLSQTFIHRCLFLLTISKWFFMRLLRIPC